MFKQPKCHPANHWRFARLLQVQVLPVQLCQRHRKLASEGYRYQREAAGPRCRLALAHAKQFLVWPLSWFLDENNQNMNNEELSYVNINK